MNKMLCLLILAALAAQSRAAAPEPSPEPAPAKKAVSPHGMKSGAGAGHARMMGKKSPVTAAELAAIKVERAPGPDGRTVAELFAQKAALKGKKVSVRGKVVKFTPAVMGKNWVHLRDGSGSAAGNDYDVTATTLDAAKLGDVVLVTGTVRADKDIGAGYKYAVLIEDSKLAR